MAKKSAAVKVRKTWTPTNLVKIRGATPLRMLKQLGLKEFLVECPWWQLFGLITLYFIIHSLLT